MRKPFRFPRYAADAILGGDEHATESEEQPESFQLAFQSNTMKTSTTYNEISGNLLFQSNGFIR